MVYDLEGEEIEYLDAIYKVNPESRELEEVADDETGDFIIANDEDQNFKLISWAEIAAALEIE